MLTRETMAAANIETHKELQELLEHKEHNKHKEHTDENTIVVPNNEIKKKRNPREKKSEIPEKKMNYPSIMGHLSVYTWAAHVADMIYAADRKLCKDENIIDAYNNFVACLEKYEKMIYTYTGPYYCKYTNCIVVHMKNNYIYCINSDSIITVPIAGTRAALDIIDINKDLYMVYNILYELIKDTVVPFMNNKSHSLKVKQAKKDCIKNVERLNKMKIKLNNDHLRFMEKHNSKMEYIENEMRQATAELESLGAL